MLSATEFAATSDGVAFYRAYDRVLDKWPVAVESTDLESEYGITRVNTCGHPDSPSLVLLPGAGATSTVWFANAGALAARYRVHAVDLMGDAGRSRAAGTPVRTVDDLLSWFDSVIRGLDLDTYALAGHSYGAMIALAHTLSRPERVSTLALLDPSSCFTGMRAHYLARAIPLLLRPTEDRQRGFLRWETRGRAVDGDWLDLLARGSAHFPSAKVVVPKRPRPSALAAMRTDTTVILAGDSRVHDSRRLADSITGTYPRIRVITVDEASHHTLPMSPGQEVDAALRVALTGRADG